MDPGVAAFPSPAGAALAAAAAPRVLIANRAEIAIRIIHAARELSWHSIAIYSKADAACRHRYEADEAHEIPSHRGDGVAAYLDVDAILALAKQHKAEYMHPGYGFLSENGDFAARVVDAGITLIGPSPSAITLFGDKVAARNKAMSCNIPVVPATPIITDIKQIHEFVTAVGLPVIIKAVAGGGGRGVGIIRDLAHINDTYHRCTREAQAAFGNGSVFVEKLMERPRHIEVQVLADRTGAVSILSDRDCSAQLNHQKIVEIAPAPLLSHSFRSSLHSAARSLARASSYVNAGTVEFLVSEAGTSFAFMEVNPRIQVEYTVTEEISGRDVIQAQMRIASGETLEQIGIPSDVPIRGYAIQARINTEKPGTITQYDVPHGHGIRCDGYAYVGYHVTPLFDSMLVKVIARSDSYPSALIRLVHALSSFTIEGISTNRDMLCAMLNHDDVKHARVHTTWVQQHQHQWKNTTTTTNNKRSIPPPITTTTTDTTPATIATTSSIKILPTLQHPTHARVVSPLSGLLISLRVLVGAHIRAGDPVACISAMKMETLVPSPVSGVVSQMRVRENDMITSGDVLMTIEQQVDASSTTADKRLEAVKKQLGPTVWQSSVDEMDVRHELASRHGGEAGVARQRSQGKLTVRERIRLLLDAPSVRPYGEGEGEGSDQAGVDEEDQDRAFHLPDDDDETPLSRGFTPATPAAVPTIAPHHQTPNGTNPLHRPVSTSTSPYTTASDSSSSFTSMPPSSSSSSSRAPTPSPTPSPTLAPTRRGVIGHRSNVLDGFWTEYGPMAGHAVYDEKDIHKIVKFTPANFVSGRGFIHRRPVMVGGDDFTVRGGHADGAVFRKQGYGEQLARDFRIPMIRLLDGSSGGGSVASLLTMGYTYVPPLPYFQTQIRMLSEVPVAASLLGPVVGLGAARAVLSHFSVMVRDLSSMFVAGPVVVAHALHENVTKETLGGVSVHGHNGSVDNIARSETDAFDQIRTWLTYMPQNAWTLPPRTPKAKRGDSPYRREEELLSIIPISRASTYDIRRIIELIVDFDSWFEIGKTWGQSGVVGLARFDGYVVGILASDCRFNGGALTASSSDKFRRHVELCNTFHLPIINLVDMPGFALGLQAEQDGTIRRGGSLMCSLFLSEVPMFSVILRRAFGVAGAALVDSADPNHRVAWPSADWGSLPVEGGMEAAFKGQLSKAKDPEALKQQLLSRLSAVRSPYRSAEHFSIEEMIDPRDTRPVICDWVTLAYHKLATETLGPRTRGATC